MSNVKNQFGLQDRHVMQLQQTLLGAVRRYDDKRNDTVHPASLQRAIESLGLKFGDEIVDRMMVMCRTTSDGLVDYSRFARHLARNDGSAWENESKKEVEATLRELHISGRRGQAAIGQSLNPFEDKDAAERREHQAQQLRDRRAELHQLFNQFDARLLTAQQFQDAIKELHIEITPQLEALLTKNPASEVQFGAVYRSLSTLNDMDNTDLRQMRAGSRIVKENDNLYGIRGLTKRRGDPWKNKATLEATGSSQKNKKKNDIAGRKKELMQSDSMKQVLDDGQVRAKPLSAMRAKMQEGIQKRVHESMSSEQRVMRQQIFAAIRKMDAGELTASQFKDRMMQIGVELPPNILKLLVDYNATGCATFNTFASAFERLLEEREAENTFDNGEMEHVFEVMLAELRAGQDVLALQRLSQQLKALDPLENGQLSLREFRGVIQEVWPGLSEEQISMVFNKFDPRGSGLTLYAELVAKFRGSMSTIRHECINRVYASLPKDSRGHISSQVLAESFKPAQHPEARAGLKKGAQVLTEFNDTFELDGEDNSVTLKNFSTYYANISALIESDDEFIDLIRSCWDLSDEAPPPMHFRVKNNGDRIMSPAAAQHHGNILAWNQRSGELESRAGKIRLGRKILNTQQSSFALVHGDPSGDGQYMHEFSWLREEVTSHLLHTHPPPPLSRCYLSFILFVEQEVHGWGKSWRKKPLKNDPVNMGLTARKALEWDQRPPPPPQGTQLAKARSQSTPHGGEGPETVPVAGIKSWNDHPHEVKEKNIPFSAHLHMMTKTPFGVDRDELSASATPATRKSSPISLKDLMAAKHGP